jgi:sulfite reductase (ferredoxin)
MYSFRHEQEQVVDNNKALVEQEILELAQKISAHKKGEISDDQFRALRLARGVYGQRQQGVQMVRIKLPFGKVITQQLNRIAEISDNYSDGLIHLTTRQDVQIYHVSLDDTPQLWEELEKDNITLREACGNTVRNITASPSAGVNPDEAFDVSPYADAVFRYFLRKPFAQELGRKIKMAFSATEEDDALTFIHDFGFIPRIENGKRGFKVLVGGGLGAQPFFAQTAFEFLEAEKLIPFVEAAIRVFDRNGERNNRNKARLKYLLAKIGLNEFVRLVEEEVKAIQFDPSFLDTIVLNEEFPITGKSSSLDELKLKYPEKDFINWLENNVFAQKQENWYSVGIKIPLGNINSDQARKFSQLFDQLGITSIRFTIQQDILLRFVSSSQLIELYQGIKEIGFHQYGSNSIANVTACPGTETCNLAISNSTHVASAIEEFIYSEFPELIQDSEIRIKISGCMNSCGQHGIAQIGLHGSSQKVEGSTVPCLQLLLGGGKNSDGTSRIGEKVIKFPSRRILTVIRTLLENYLQENDDESFNDYYDRKGNKYFYDLLKPIADTTTISESDYIDWGSEERFKTAIGVGECAGVVIDLVATLFYDVEEKLEKANRSYLVNAWADSIYHSYSAGIIAAKAFLMHHQVKCNSQLSIIESLDELPNENWISLKNESFKERVLQIKKELPTEEFAKSYYETITQFVAEVKQKIKNK